MDTKSAMINKIKAFDYYRKIPQDLSEKSMSGGLVSVFCAIIMLILFISEFRTYLQTSLRSEMSIDVLKATQNIQINMDIIFPKMTCFLIEVEIKDQIGSHSTISIKKTRLRSNGDVIGPFFDGDNDPIRTQQMAKDFEGCRIQGMIMTKKVPGNIIFSKNNAFDNNSNDSKFSHKIIHLSFGSETELNEIKKYFNKNLFPLDGNEKIESQCTASTLIQYYLNIVPISFTTTGGWTYQANQFTYNTHQVEHRPALVIKYGISPLSVKYTMERESFAQFFVQISAIIGGVFVVASFIDSLVDKAGTKREKKADLE